MLVKNWMSRDVITIDADESILTATRTLKENNIRMLPVMEAGKLVGVVTDKDLKKASASDATTLEVHELLYLIDKVKIREIMTQTPPVIYFDHTLDETAELFMEHKLSGAPVVDHDNNLVGVITETDMFKALISLNGLSGRGIQFAFLLEDRPGSIKDVADIIRKYGGRMASILTSYDRAKKGYRKVYIRMYNIDRLKLMQLKQELKKFARLLYMVDFRENVREIFEGV